ncbi:MAG: hypothetical protein RML46_01950 [Anaerolineae bacterium]|nr:hypothetical protein [Anaerolineae bacterium]MDW8067658.1 hypothetical protein [Anaerolineae bacterium]
MRRSPGIYRWLPSIDALWSAVVLAGLGFLISLIPLPPNDFWWHLKIGEVIFTTRAIPTTNMFSWTLPSDAPFTYGAWLGELLLYLVYRAGGLPLVTFARNFLLLMAFWLVGRTARERSGSWRLTAPALALAGGMSLNNLIIRPQIWVFPLFALYLWWLTRYITASRSARSPSDWRIPARRLLLLPLLMAFWVNVHGSFVLGLVLVGIFAVGETLRTACRPARSEAVRSQAQSEAVRSQARSEAECRISEAECRPDALPWRRVGLLWGIGALTALATLANPRGVGIAAYVVDLLTDRPSQALVVEWQSPTPSGMANVIFYVSILVLLLTLAFSRRRPTPTDLLLTVGFLWLAWSGMRYVVWYGMVVMPILAQEWAALWPHLVARPARRHPINLILLLLLTVPVLLVQPWWVEQMPLPETYWQQVWRGSPIGPLVGRETPIAAVEYLRAHPGGRLFHEMGYGSYLIWAMPEQKVFVDPRVELYPYDQWMDYIRIGRGVRYHELLEHYGADRLMVDRELQGELIRALEDDPRWEQEYADERTEIWRRAR